MLVAGSVIAVLAALLHVYIFSMESLTWTSERTRAVFGLSPEQARTTREMALNQGFYNLFLAVVAVLGAAFVFCGAQSVGAALLLAGTGSMLAAALVLLATSPAKWSLALKQGALPLLAVLDTIIALV